MKKMLLSTILFFSLLQLNAQSNDQQAIKITGTKFPFDIMQKWIDEFSKIHPEVKFQLDKSIPLDSADLTIAAHRFNPGELKDDQAIVAVNRYAQLPIVNGNRPDLQTLQQKGFTQQDLKNIFFLNKENKTDALNNPATIYKRDKNVCASRAFSESIMGDKKDIYGIGVTGDDRALSSAVKTDVTGISYNNLGFVYNIQTRKANDSLAIIPIDVNENGVIDNDEKNYATLDNILDFISRTNNLKIPQENVNIVINKDHIRKSALEFLNWVITEGQKYNRYYGFLDLNNSVVTQGQAFLNTILKDDSTAGLK
jgi:phosphate transport system substrate-binding protein